MSADVVQDEAPQQQEGAPRTADGLMMRVMPSTANRANRYSTVASHTRSQPKCVHRVGTCRSDWHHSISWSRAARLVSLCSHAMPPTCSPGTTTEAGGGRDRDWRRVNQEAGWESQKGGEEISRGLLLLCQARPLPEKKGRQKRMPASGDRHFLVGSRGLARQ